MEEVCQIACAFRIIITADSVATPSACSRHLHLQPGTGKKKKNPCLIQFNILYNLKVPLLIWTKYRCVQSLSVCLMVLELMPLYRLFFEHKFLYIAGDMSELCIEWKLNFCIILYRQFESIALAAHTVSFQSYTHLSHACVRNFTPSTHCHHFCYCQQCFTSINNCILLVLPGWNSQERKSVIEWSGTRLPQNHKQLSPNQTMQVNSQNPPQ